MTHYKNIKTRNTIWIKKSRDLWLFRHIEKLYPSSLCQNNIGYYCNASYDRCVLVHGVVDCYADVKKMSRFSTFSPTTIIANSLYALKSLTCCPISFDEHFVKIHMHTPIRQTHKKGLVAGSWRPTGCRAARNAIVHVYFNF